MTDITLEKEEQRLSALHSYHILGTSTEADFDELTELAAAICDTLVALISFVDKNRLWFKAHYGLDINHTVRRQSFCDYAIQQPEILTQIEDTQKDVRFQENPLVIENQEIRFYAGVPLVDETSHALGTICVIDYIPRTLNRTQQNALRNLASQIVGKLLLKKKIMELEVVQQTLKLNKNSIEISSATLQGCNNSTEDHKELQTANEQLSSIRLDLEQTQIKLNIAIESAGLGFFTFDFRTICLKVNEQFLNIFGFPSYKEPSMRQIKNTIDPSYMSEIPEIISKGITSGKAVDLLYKIKHQVTGEDRWIKGMGKAQFSSCGEPEYFIGVNIDVTKEVQSSLKTKQLNMRLREKKARLQNILDTVGEGIGITDEKGDIIYTNQRNREIFKFKEKDMLKLNNTASEWNNRRLDGSPLSDDEHPITMTLRTGNPILNYEFLVNDQKGSSIYLRMNTTPIKDAEGNITGAIGSFSDITETYLLQQKLKEKEENLRMAIAPANLGIWRIDIQTREFFPSVRCKELFGFYPDEKMPYNAVVAQIADSHRQSVIATLDAAINQGKTYDLEYPIIGYHDKKLRWVHALGSLYTSLEGTAHFSGTMADITEQKLNEQRRSDFISMVSHELRSPLTAIGLHIYILEKKAKNNNDSMVADTAAKINKQVKRMEALINGFLEVAQLGEEKIRLNRTLFDMADLVRITEEESLATITSHQVIFQPVQFTQVKADKDKIEQVLINLINNSVKYSPKNTNINVSCITKENMVHVCVSDQGMGIPTKDQSFIFDRFYRVESEEMKNKKGFGIGLYICKEIIERHNGQKYKRKII